MPPRRGARSGLDGGGTPQRPTSRSVERMLRRIARDVRDPRVLTAMRRVPRHEFVPRQLRRFAYDDTALPIGGGQTISQPLIVALMAEGAAIGEGDRVLELGTGSGYGAAVLAQLGADVVTVERLDGLRRRAQQTLARLGVGDVRCVAAGEALGAPSLGPYDAIIVTAAAPAVPAALLEQLREGGRLVIPVGSREEQELLVITKRSERFERRSLGGCRFVPLIGEEAFAEGDPRSDAT